MGDMEDSNVWFRECKTVRLGIAGVDNPVPNITGNEFETYRNL